MLAPLLTAAAAAVVAAFSWRRRNAAIGRVFVAMMLAVAVWCGGMAAALADPAHRQAWTQVAYLGISSTPPLWLLFTLRYTGRRHWLRGARLLALAALPVVTLSLVWTNPRHHLYWTNDLVGNGLAAQRGPLYLPLALYSYLLVLGGMAALFEGLFRSKWRHPAQIAAVLGGVSVPFAANVGWQSGLLASDQTPSAFGVTCLAFAWSLYRFGALDVIPAARAAVIDAITDGVIVLDAQFRVADMNRAAAQFVGVDPAAVRGRSASRVLAGWPIFGDGAESQSLVTRSSLGSAREIDVRVRTVRSRGAVVGALVLMRDLTRRRETAREVRLLSSAVKSAGEGMAIVGSDGRILFVNDVFSATYGWAASALVGRPASCLDPPGEAGLWARLSAEEWQGELTQCRRDGRLFPAALSLSTVRDEAGRRTAAVVVMRDESERRAAEAELRRSNDYLAALHEATLALMRRRGLDEVLEAVISRAAEMLGTPHGYVYLAEGEGEAVLHIATGVFAPLRGDRLRPGVGLAGQVWAGGEPFVIDGYDEWAGRREVVPRGQVRAVVGVPLRSGGRLAGVLGLAQPAGAPTGFSEEDVALLSCFAQLAAMALDNARLFAEADREVGERRRAERELQQSEEGYRGLVENAAEMIYRTDARGTFSYVNAVFVRQLGYSEAEARGMGYLEVVAPSHREDTRAFYLRQLAEGVENTYLELPVATRRGTTVWIGQNVQLVYEDGRVAGFQAYARDVSARRRVEAELLRTEARYRELVEGARDVVLRIDLQGRLTYANAVALRLSGYAEEELQGLDFVQLVRPDWRERVADFYLRQLQERTAETYFEFPCQAKGGHELWVGQTTRLLEEEGRPAGFQAVARDVTERRRADEALARANAELAASARRAAELAAAAQAASEARSRFLASMSHELRTPLHAVLGFSELALDGVYGEAPPRAREVLGRIETNGRHLLGLINDVLDLAGIESGRLTLSLGPYSMSTLVREVLSATESLARAKGLEVRAELGEGAAEAEGDARRLRQVLLNLVGNAIKFTERGQVGVRLRRQEQALLVNVWDTGPGIAAADRERIFEEFQQADGSATRRAGGTGLGLAIARRIVERHGGRLWVESEPGRGSDFHLRLPLAVEARA